MPPAQGAQTRPPAAPVVSPRYQIRRFVGAGTFGSVWEAFDLWRGESRALKLLSPEHRSREWRARFFHEFALLYRLRHPGLVAASDYAMAPDDGPFFAMDWVDGSTLDRGSWSPDRRLRIAWELLDSLAYLHRQKIIHADIKAGNIRVDQAELDRPLHPEGPRATKLLDFGLTLDARVRQEEARRGTVHYMAPEWFQSGDIDYRIDLYAVGVLLFELWAGRTPFDGSDPLVVIRQHLESTPPELRTVVEEVPAPVSEAAARLLAKQPEVRDRGWRVLCDFLAEHFGVLPGSGRSAMEFHAQSLGAARSAVPDDALNGWLGSGHRPRLLYLRGGSGLNQDQILRAILPDVCRHGQIPWLVENIDQPLPPEVSSAGAAAVVPLIVVAPERSEACARFVEQWSPAGGPGRRAALSLAADDGRTRALALSLADRVRRDECVLLPVRCMEDAAAEVYLQSVLGRTPPPAALATILRAAEGNCAALLELARDYDAAAAGVPASGTFATPRADRYAERGIGRLRESFPAAEISAMTLLAAARAPIDRATLRALADIPWNTALATWLDLGLIRGAGGAFSWARPDLGRTLLAGASAERRRIIHRAWAEYWGSRSPEPGSPEHEHLVYHLLRSDAHRKAVRIGLESARYWTARHQAQRSLEILDQAAAAMREVNDPAPSLIYELAIANAEARRVAARYGDALEHLEGALRSPALRGQLRWEAEIFKRMGDLYKSLKQSEAGKRALQEALSRFRELSDRAEISHVLNNIGNIHYVAGELDQALATYREALALQRELHLEREIASTLNNIGGLLVLRSEYEAATTHLTEAVAIKRRLGDPEELARSLNNLAVAYVETGKFALASDVLTESYRINVEGGKTGEQLFNLENLALVAMARGEWAEAMSHCERGLQLCDASEERESRLPYLLVMAGVSLTQGNYDLIPAALGEADQILAKLEDADLKLHRLLFQSEWAHLRQRFDEAEESACRAVADAEAGELPAWAMRARITRARNSLSAGAADSRAAIWLEEALDSAQAVGALPEQIQARTLLAELAVDAARLDGAGDHLRQCEALLLECSAKPLFLPFSHALGRFYVKRGDREMALSVFDTARKLATNLTHLEWIWRFHAQAGHQLLALRRFDGAVDQYRSAMVLLEHLVGKLAGEERERYMAGNEKLALAEGLRACHQALVR